MRQDLQRLVLLFSFFAIVATLLAAVAGHAISGRALLPLKRMAERARIISADRLSERLPVDNSQDDHTSVHGSNHPSGAKLTR